jgi:DNA-directed RNA polymerase beta subunit
MAVLPVKKESKGRENLVKATDVVSKSVTSLVTKEKMDYYNKLYNNSDEFMGNELLTLANRISSPRVNLFIQQMPQALMLMEPDVPEVYTGYEHEVGKHSQSYYRSDRNWKVIHKISKFKNHPDLKYYLVLLDAAGYYDIVLREHAQVLTESYGYVNNNGVMDSKKVGDVVFQNEVISKSSAFDDAMNYRYGKNARVAAISCPYVTEDAMWVSKQFLEQLKYPTIYNIEVPYNTNELYVNAYGDENIYKTFPDIGEFTKLSILCAKRRISNKSIVYSLRDSTLRNVHSMDDDVYYADGQLIDIDIFCNKKPDEIQRTAVSAQLMYYYDEQQAFYKQIKSVLGKIITKHPGRVSDRLLHIYHRVEDLISGKPIVNGNTKFENMTVVFTVLNINTPMEGSKLTGRFGEKGVIGTIKDARDMPKNQYGETIDIVVNPQSSIARLNLGQWSEMELTFLAHNVCRDLKLHQIPVHIGMPKVLEFLQDVNPVQAKQMGEYFMTLNPDTQRVLYHDIINGGLKIRQPPYWGNVGFEEFRRLYKKYRYPKYRCTLSGEPIIKRLIFGTKYIMLLKQTPKSKFSARGLGMQGSLGHPSKSIRYKKHREPHSSTPIRLGEQEISNMSMMNNSELVAKFLQIYASSQSTREQFVTDILTTSNPFDIRFDPVESNNINRRILNALLKASGTRLSD